MTKETYLQKPTVKRNQNNSKIPNTSFPQNDKQPKHRLNIPANVNYNINSTENIFQHTKTFLIRVLYGYFESLEVYLFKLLTRIIHSRRVIFNIFSIISN